MSATPAPRGTEVLTEWASKALLGPVPRPRELRSLTVDEAVEFARQLDGDRVVAKASGIAHKTEGRLVRLGLDAAGVAECWDELAIAGDGTVLVAEQLHAELELIVGGVRDPQFGPVVSIGLGGVTAELFRDVVFLLAPLEDGELDEALGDLRAESLLTGYRGRPRVDRTALGSIVNAVADLLVGDRRVVEVDCNPVMVCNGQPFVVDALVVRES